MKYCKLAAFLLGAATMVSCSEFNTTEAPKLPGDYNSKAGVTVKMEKDTIMYKENKNLVNIPFEVVGDANGYVTVTFTVKEYQGNVWIRGEEKPTQPAMDDVHYLVTSKSVTVAPGDSIGNVELRLVDDMDINDPRAFEISIEGVQGATVSGLANTVVVIRDNDAELYDKLSGSWYAKCTDYDDAEITVKFQFDACDEEDPGYEKYYNVTGDGNWSAGYFQADFEADMTTMKGTISVKLSGDGQLFSTGVQFSGLGACDVIMYKIVNGNLASGTDVFTWNEEMTELTLTSEESTNWWLTVNPQGTSSLYIWECYNGITRLTREP